MTAAAQTSGDTAAPTRRDDATGAGTTGGAGTTAPGMETDRVAGPHSSMAAPATATAGTSNAVSVMVVGGNAFMARGGIVTRLESTVTLTISPDGTITGFDGKKFAVPDKQMLTMDGRLTPIPDALLSSVNASGAVSAVPEKKR
jgi:hypothetical protein